MKRILLGVALTMVAHAAFAAIEYEYVQTSRSDSNNASATDFSARATVDGQRSKVVFLSGNAYPPGTYVISSDAGRTLQFVDPGQKLYTEVNAVAVASAIGASNILIDNFVARVAQLDDKPIIAGVPTDHYRLTMTYDMTVTYRNMPLRQSVRTEIDKWTTVRFGDGIEAALLNALLTGNPKIDELIQAETTKIKGFPLKQTVRITTINSKAGPTNSQLKIPATRVRSRETTVTAIKETRVSDALFVIPAEYRKSDFAEQAPKSPTQIQNFEPTGDSR